MQILEHQSLFLYNVISYKTFLPLKKIPEITSHLHRSIRALGVDLTGKSKPVSKQLLANPKAEICAFKDGVWLRIAAELIEDDRVEARKAMLDAYPHLRSMYDENDGNTQAFYLRNATATFSSFTGAPETVTF